MKLTTYFEDFLKDIRPTSDQQDTMAKEHKRLRDRLEAEHKLLAAQLRADPAIGPILLGTFIQGSYRRYTGVKGGQGHCCDVDIVAVTSLPKNDYTARYTLELFKPFLEKHYVGKYEAQDRSWCIRIDDEVKLDLVPTSEPEEQALQFLRTNVLTKGWDFPVPEPTEIPGVMRTREQVILARAKEEAGWDVGEPLWIPDRKSLEWDRTHPLYQIKWSAAKNQQCNGHYINVVKAIKWWKRFKAVHPKRPKGYPLEHIISLCCPDQIESVAEGIVLTLEAISRQFAAEASMRQTPVLPDHALPENNVLARIDGSDFALFHASVTNTSVKARRALEESDRDTSVRLWYEIMGAPFPEPPTDGGYTEPKAPAVVSGARFA